MDDVEEPTKSRAGRRATKVDDEVLDILQRHREAQELERLSAVIRVPRGRPQRRPQALPRPGA